MFISVSDLLPAVARATVALSLSAGIAWGILSWFKPESPRLRRIIWFLVLLQGIILLRIPVAIPWYAVDTGNTMLPVLNTVASSAPDIVGAKDSAHAVPATVRKSNNPIDWRSIVCGMWLAGCGLTLIWWALVHVRVSRRGVGSQEPTQEWARQWQSLLEQHAVTEAIPLQITDDTGPLVVWGPGGAAVLVPRELWESLSSQQRLAILRHELAHYRRGDLWKGALIRLMALPHWFNPLAWWIVRNLDECAEWLCDDEATGRDRGVATEYAEVLLRLGQKVRSYGMTATAMRGGRLHRRICRVLTPLPMEKSTMKKYLLVAVPVVLLAGHLIRVELVARAQVLAAPRAEDSKTTAAPAITGFSAARLENGIFIKGNYLRPSGLSVALSLPSVQKELGIDKGSSQFEEMEKLKAAHTNEIQAGLTKLFDEGRRTRENEQELLMGLYAKHDLEIKNLLKPEQAARLRQIMLQDAGAGSLWDAEVAKALNITKDQEEKLAALLSEVETKQRDILNPSEDKRPENEVIKEKVQKLQELNADRDKKANEILTAAQREKFAEMKGKPFDLAQLPPQFSPPRSAGRPSGRLGMPTGVGPSLMEMALREPILKELGIEKDAPQVAELRKLADAYSQDVRNSIRDQTLMDATSPQELGLKLQARFDPDLKKMLTSQQYTRLRQIRWQLPGANRLDDPDLVKALDIKPEQREKLDALTVEIFRKRVAILNANSGRGPADVDAPKKMTELNVEWSKKINEILSTAEQEKLAELKGKPFDASLLQSPPSGVVGGLPGQKSDKKTEEKKE